mgnify:CR=1 FL=1
MAAASMDEDNGQTFPTGASAGSRWTVPDSATREGLAGLLRGGRRGGAPRYRPGAYEEAPRIRHGGSALRFALSPGAAYGLVGGAATAALLLFVAGFLVAYWLFAPESPFVRAQTQTVASAEAPGPSRDFITRATAGDAPETPAPPAPEIAAAQERLAQAQAEAEADGQSPAAPDVAAPQLAAVPAEPAAPGAAPETAPVPAAPATVAPEIPAASDLPLPPIRPAPPAVKAEQQTAALAPATKPAPSGDAGPYRLQFGAYSVRANAEEMLAKVPAALKPRIVEGTGSGGTPLFFVRSRGFETLAAARDAGRTAAKEAGLQSFVRRTPQDG